MQPRNPDYQATVRSIMDRAALVADLGIVLTAVGPGWCETEVAIQPRHLQQNRFPYTLASSPPSETTRREPQPARSSGSATTSRWS